MRTIGEYYIATKVKYISSVVLSQSLDDLGTTRGECLGRTRWSSPLDWTTYLYYFYKWLYTTSLRSHVLLECSIIAWPCHVIWLLKFPCYLYLVSIVWLDVCNQVFEHTGNFFLLRALITCREWNGNSIEFSLLTQTWSGFKSSWLKSYRHLGNVTVVLWTSSHILYGLPLHQKGDVSKATC